MLHEILLMFTTEPTAPSPTQSSSEVFKKYDQSNSHANSVQERLKAVFTSWVSLLEGGGVFRGVCLFLLGFVCSGVC